MQHGIVIGGSIAGMLAARVMSDSFERVTVIERDELTDEVKPRKGVPQGRQIHACLPMGIRIHEQLLPGFIDEMQGLGAPLSDLVCDYGVYGRHGWVARAESDLRVIGFTRPLFESVVRQRVTSIPNVEVVHGNALGLAMSDDGRTAIGVKAMRNGCVETIECDLVVDASGRGTRAPKWMEDLGFGRPTEQHVKIHMGYASVLIRVPDGAIPADMRGIAAESLPGFNRGGSLMPVENGLHMLVATGMVRDYPPGDWEGLLAFLADARTPLVYEIAKQSERVGEVASYRMPGNMRRRWEELTPRPGRFVAIGDAVGSYNPHYGQGMTLASYGASVLAKRLSAPDADLDAVPQLFQDDLARGVDWAFSTASSLDSQYEGVEFEGIDPLPAPTDFDHHLEQLQTEDAALVQTVWRSFGYMEPELLESEEVKAKVTAWGMSGKRPSNVDPLSPPAALESAVG